VFPPFPQNSLNSGPFRPYTPVSPRRFSPFQIKRPKSGAHSFERLCGRWTGQPSLNTREERPPLSRGFPFRKMGPHFPLSFTLRIFPPELSSYCFLPDSLPGESSTLRNAPPQPCPIPLPTSFPKFRPFPPKVKSYYVWFFFGSPRSSLCFPLDLTPPPSLSNCLGIIQIEILLYALAANKSLNDILVSADLLRPYQPPRPFLQLLKHALCIFLKQKMEGSAPPSSLFHPPHFLARICHGRASSSPRKFVLPRFRTGGGSHLSREYPPGCFLSPFFPGISCKRERSKRLRNWKSLSSYAVSFLDSFL